MVEGLYHAEERRSFNDCQTVMRLTRINSLCQNKKNYFPHIVSMRMVFYFINIFFITHKFSTVHWANFIFPLTSIINNSKMTLTKSANQKQENRKCFVKKHGIRIINFQCTQLKVEGQFTGMGNENWQVVSRIYRQQQKS